MKIIDMDVQHLDYVARCGYSREAWNRPEEIAEIKKTWLRKRAGQGMIIKVAIDSKGQPVGFARGLPIHLGAWGIKGRDLLTITCLVVETEKINGKKNGSGIGRQLVLSLDKSARKEYMGLAVRAFDMEFPYMPYSFFSKIGFHEIARRNNEVLMLKEFVPVSNPEFLDVRFKFEPVKGKVVVDLFWNPLCMTSITELFTVRSVCEELGDRVILHEYCTGESEIFEKYGTERALFINGTPKCWGFDAPADELKAEILLALNTAG
ncbi:MAG: hypothetical protein PHQ23_04800 [Candidatus Wallbacteria bacterium]|nr:hypothetical protein [Candidatus Wallbacteria bacterium]